MNKATNEYYHKNIALFSVLALTLVFSLSSVLFSAGIAYADNVNSRGSAIEFDIVGSAIGEWKLVATSANQPGGDLIDGCNASPANPVIATINTPAGLTASPSTLTFYDCASNVYQSTTFTATLPGVYLVTVTADDVNNIDGAAYKTSPNGDITITVVGDNIPPTVTVTPPRDPDVNGWYNDTIEFSVTGTDASGIASCNTPIVYDDPDSATATVTGECTDNAGNTGSTDYTFQYDDTPPVVTLTPDTAPDYNGWYNNPVTFTVSGVDEVSTVTCDSAVIYSGPDSATATVTGSCTDEAGNTGSATTTFQYDSTAPVITINGADPLYLQDNGVAFSDPGASILDDTSGPDADGVISAGSVDTNTPEVYYRTYNAKDNAGNNAIEVTRTVDVVHVSLDTSRNVYILGDNVYVKVLDFLAWRDSDISSVPATITSTSPGGVVRESISPLVLAKTEAEGVFTNQNPVTLVLNDNCLAELTCQEPLLTVVVDDDVAASYITFLTANARVADSSASGFLGSPPRSTDVVRFLESDQYQQGGAATVKVNDALASGSVDVLITSTLDPTGFVITLNEDSSGSGTFTSETAITFTTGDTSEPSIKAIVGNTVTATYGASIATLSIVENDSVIFVNGVAIDNTRRDACATDADGDGICDAWETATGLRIPTTIPGVDYFIGCTAGATIVTDPTGQTVCPSPSQKDVYLEIDYMLGHTPNNDALNDVKTALKSAPIRGLPGGAINGIVLHRFVDDETPHQTLMPYTAGAGQTSFLSVKQSYFGTLDERTNANSNALLTAKRQVFHWAYVGHQQLGDENSSGLGEKPGNDFWITMGAFTGKQGTRGQQAGTFMHELGHNFGLGHGGGDANNCKGNYLSVMNYLSQFDQANGGFLANRPLAYSYYKFSDIVETALREDINTITAQSKPTVIGGASLVNGVITPFALKYTNTNTKIDWNRDNTLIITNTPYAQDTNYFADLTDCQALSGDGSPLKSTLTGYNDGANIVYNFRGQSTFDSGAVVVNQIHSTTSTDGEITTDQFDTRIEVDDLYLIQSGTEGISGFSGNGQYSDPDATSITGTISHGDDTTSDLAITLVPDVGATFTFPSHTYVDDGIYGIAVTITATRIDAGGNEWSYDTTITGTFTVENANPIVNAGSDASVTTGESYQLSDASFTDLGTDDDPWTVLVDWGDSTTSTTSQATQNSISSISHVFTLGQFFLSQTFEVIVSVTDKDAGSGLDSKTITVSRLIVESQLSSAASTNGLKVNDKGTTQISILSSNPNTVFDATKITASTVKVKSQSGSESCSGASVVKSDNTKDQNGDGVKDMLMHVKTNQLCIVSGISPQTLIITGSTSTGIQFGSTVLANVVS